VDTTDEAAESRARWVVLVICCMSLLVASLDVSAVNVALPAIRRDLGASIAGLQWTVDGYTLVLATLLILSGSLADRFGRRRIFLVGLALFVIGSLLCSLASTLGWLVGFRMVQAVGGSMLNPVALSIISNTFTDAAERARAMGVWGAVVGVSLALGPVVGGTLVSTIGWRSIFWINVPIGFAAIVLARRYVPESKSARIRRFDPSGQLLVAVSVAALICAIIEGPALGWNSGLIVMLFVAAAVGGAVLLVVETRRAEPLIDLRFFRSAAVSVAALICAIIEGPALGWNSGLIVMLFVAAAVGGAVLLVVETRRAEPLIDLRFFRSAAFSGATFTAFASFAALSGFLFLNSLYLQDERGYSALTAGLLTLPLAVTASVLSPISGRLVAAGLGRVALCVSGGTIAVGASTLVTLTRDSSLTLLTVAYIVLGAGFGMVNAPVSDASMSDMPRSKASVAAAIVSTGRQAGAALGVAVSGSIVAGRTAAGDNLADATHVVWMVIAGLGLVVVILGAVTTTGWARATAASVRDLLDGEEEHANAI